MKKLVKVAVRSEGVSEELVRSKASEAVRSFGKGQ